MKDEGRVDEISELLSGAYSRYARSARRVWPGRFNDGPRSNLGSQERYLAGFLWEQFSQAGFDLCPEMPLNIRDVKKKADLLAVRAGPAPALVWFEIKQAYDRSSTQSWRDEMRKDMARINAADCLPRGWLAGAGVIAPVFGVVIGLAVDGLIAREAAEGEFAKMAADGAAGRALKTEWLETAPVPPGSKGEPRRRWLFHAIWQVSRSTPTGE